MPRKLIIGLATATAAVLAASTPAFAIKSADLRVDSHSYDEASGAFGASGFVAKPIIYTLDKKGGVTGTTGNHVVVTMAIDGGSYTCEWDTETGGKKSKTIHHSATRGVDGVIVSGVTSGGQRTNNTGKTTGYLWTATGSIDAPAALPHVGDACEPESQGGIVTAVEAGAGGRTLTVAVVDSAGGSITLDDISTGGAIGDALQQTFAV